ncbi:hypothetical protein [Dyella agri]|uniref:Uncharacterized protein n=1 Tax=Dyella agri TaxID=1926869 RepID=A0ABW8KKQ4_9GAMM
MPRPDHTYINAQALKFVSDARGSCDQVSDELCTAALFWSNAPRKCYPIHALVRGDYAQNHIAMAALWSGDDDNDRLIVNPTIAQFGGDRRVFIGTADAWLAELSRLHNGAPAELDPGGSKFNSAWMHELPEAKTAAVQQEQRRSSHVSQDSHMADTLKKTKPCCGCVVM